MRKLLVVDAEDSIRCSLKEVLEYESYSVDIADNGCSAFDKICQQQYDAILSGIQMPQMDGFALLQKIREREDTPVILINRNLDVNMVIKSMKLGANDFLQKPVDLNKLFAALNESLSTSNLRKKRTSFIKNTPSNKQTQTPIIGTSESLNDILQIVDKVAPTDERILITGENGTGKELIARRIHEMSNRKNKPFIAVNCAAIPSELIESQLFGHEKGSFTSAIKQHRGDFEQANGGTLFLDEIGDMSLMAQSKILRVLQENKITRVGGEESIPVNVRVIAATNKDIKGEIQAGRFREDLYHRISIIVIHVPPLSHRREDIPLLVKHFLSKIEISYPNRTVAIEPGAIEILQKLTWTGNIRELKNSIERLCILCDKVITKKDVEKYVQW